MGFARLAFGLWYRDRGERGLAARAGTRLAHRDGGPRLYQREIHAVAERKATKRHVVRRPKVISFWLGLRATSATQLTTPGRSFKTTGGLSPGRPPALPSSWYHFVQASAYDAWELTGIRHPELRTDRERRGVQRTQGLARDVYALEETGLVGLHCQSGWEPQLPFLQSHPLIVIDRMYQKHSRCLKDVDRWQHHLLKWADFMNNVLCLPEKDVISFVDGTAR